MATYTINKLTGIVTINPPFKKGDIVTVDYEYSKPKRVRRKGKRKIARDWMR